MHNIRAQECLQEALLSDENKRFLYDVGIHDNDYDTDGMANFLNEMATVMNQNKPTEKVETSFEELKDLFNEMFQGDIESFGLFSETKSFTSINKRGSYDIWTTRKIQRKEKGEALSMVPNTKLVEMGFLQTSRFVLDTCVISSCMVSNVSVKELN
ncbi:hypothetical protein L2E82_02669 [Cichorium intybus]|uniref:Uncharacterized protein n=1 Tax=Cichorium intybus TaxID=13427 RepID=A0ACB9H3E2_CICIN|nr:hypothetical protein L2E82_02669 [Cichorium intybus]